MRLYGEFSGNHSLVRVSEGFADAFPEASRFGLNDLSNELDTSASGVGGATDPVAVFVGNLRDLPKVRFLGKHKHVYAMVAPNSTSLGKSLPSILSEYCDTILVPSDWAKPIVEKHCPNKEVLVAPHGVCSDFEAKPLREEPDIFRVLHLSSSTLSRKGTEELLHAWKLADLPNARLAVSVPEHKVFDFSSQARLLDIQNLDLTYRLNLSRKGAGNLYNLFSFVCQPSRGEGFGLVPLEARACGVPAIMTDCTGHSQHANLPGTAIIKTGELKSIDDFPDALAPELRIDDIAEQLSYAYCNRRHLRAKALENAKNVSSAWSWSKQLESLKERIEEHDRI